MVSAPRAFGPAPRQRRAVATRRRIYDAAMAEYARVGLDAARVEDIVAAAEVSWGTFFHYFPTGTSKIAPCPRISFSLRTIPDTT